MPDPQSVKALIKAGKQLRDACEELEFASPVTHVYNPLEYAWKAHELFLEEHGASPKKVIFMGMNPGPFGMAQTSVPFGEIEAVRDWIGINTKVNKPKNEHTKRPIDGFDCTRSEVSGRRLWGLFKERFGTARKFFKNHYVLNYCPLAFMEETGRNRTPDKLPASEIAPLTEICDAHLRKVIEILEPEWFIGVGGYAEDCVKRVMKDDESLKIGRILHPSPASPAANKDWAGTATRQMVELGIWKTRS